MTRILVQIFLPLILPTVAFFLWAWIAKRIGVDPHSNVLQGTPWFWLIIAGVLLMGVGLTATALMQGAEPGSHIIAPRLENGRVVPAQIE
jgi:uncharacterized membrane-anchored protein YitT (DUF2179 family)